MDSWWLAPSPLLLIASQTFINGIVMFRTVDRPAFSAIQQKLFPIYFGLQTVLPIVMALTFPGNSLIGLSSGLSGLLSDFSRWHSLLPIATMFVTGLLNFAILLPATTGVMKERRGQGMLMLEAPLGEAE